MTSRNRSYALRLTEAEYAELQEAAERHGLSMASLIRAGALAEARRRDAELAEHQRRD